MKTAINKLIPIKTLNQNIDIENITFPDDKTVQVSLKLDGISFTLIVAKDFAVKNLFSTPGQSNRSTATKASPVKKRPTTKVSRDPKDGAELIDENDMEKLMKGGVEAAKTRRIRCPKTGNLIESAIYHENKKAGMYADIK